jgi:orotate phosphoribosyltransferase
VNPLPEQVRDLSRAVAAELLRQGAIKVSVEAPFLLTSGNHSPIYVNCRQLISSRCTVHLIVAAASLAVELHKCEFDIIAGGETAGIPFASFLADALNKPMIYVRKGVKGHGTGSQIEGVLQAGSRVLLVEDLVTDGQSKMSFIESIRSAGGIVAQVLVVFDLLKGGSAMLGGHGVQLIALTDLEVALHVATDWSLLGPDLIVSVRQYLRSPAEWHAQKGLSYSAAGE